MKNRIMKSKPRHRVIEKETTGDITWRKFANGTQTLEIVGKRRTQLLRAAKNEGMTPQALVNWLLKEHYSTIAGEQEIGTVKKHELSLFKPDGVAICFAEVEPDQVRDFLKFAKGWCLTPREALWEAFQGFIERRSGGVKQLRKPVAA